MLNDIDQSLKAFYDATVELGLSDKIANFTASVFGRALQGNGDGSDHGWGAHHFIIGYAVKGGRFCNTPPDISNNSTDLVSPGRLVPTTSVDQFGATLGRWFGNTDGDLADVFPRLDRFDVSDLGYFG